MASQVKEVVGQPPNPSRPPFNKGRSYSSLEKGGKRNLRATSWFAYPGWFGQFQRNLPLLPGLRQRRADASGVRCSRPLDSGHGLWPWAPARDGVPREGKSSRGRPERSAAKSKGDEAGAPGSAQGDPPRYCPSIRLDDFSPHPPSIRPPTSFDYLFVTPSLHGYFSFVVFVNQHRNEGLIG